jgi:hypothetical protein
MRQLYRQCHRDNFRRCNRPGIVLMMTIVLLVILSLVGYMLVTRLAAQRHRDQYIIDYQVARYACDSAVKYALVALTDVNTSHLVSRPNEPDFSDLFALDDEQYKKMLDDWVRQNAANQAHDSNLSDVAEMPLLTELESLNDLNDGNDANSLFAAMEMNVLKPAFIPGPYGPAWPYVTEPLEFQIGSATVKIEIEDENAKFPLGWSMLDEKEGQREGKAGFETFCEWMKLDRDEIDALESQAGDVAGIKTFKLDFKTTEVSQPAASKPAARRSRRGRRARPKTTTVSSITHTADFAKLFHSGLIDLDALAKPTNAGSERQESALKYMGVWASKSVNINTAPRHVLEAAFAFGGDGEKIADEIIRRRRIQPFSSIDELKKDRILLRYSDSIKKTEKYITTTSDFFTIRVTATSGVARVSAIIAVTMADKKMQKIAVLSG